MMDRMEMAFYATIAELDALGFVAWPIPEPVHKKIMQLDEDMTRAYVKHDYDEFMKLLDEWEMTYKTNQP